MPLKPQVFIIESLRDNQVNDSLRGSIVIKRILTMCKKEPISCYVRNVNGFKKALIKFRESKYRYLHIICHGSSRSLTFGNERVDFKDLKIILNPYLNRRRLFFASCQVFSAYMKKHIMEDSNCLSILGSNTSIPIPEAALLGANFYYKMFKNEELISPQKIKLALDELYSLFDTKLKCYFRTKSNSITEYSTIRS